MDPWQIVLLAGVGGQLLKLLLYGIASRRFSLRVLVATNGLPSLYATSFAALTTVVGRVRGAGSSEFVATAIFTGIVLHDLIRVQGTVHAGGRTALLLADSLAGAAESPFAERLRELLGDRRHRPLHIGIGLVLGTLAGLLWNPASR
jgi:acid phosphatase family membrane protein YuiD